MNGGARILDRPAAWITLRAVDYLTLMKPELTGLSVLTALFGTYLALGGAAELRPYLVVFAGTLLVGGGAGALNQFLERREDSLMKRTERRPLPALRVTPAEALLLGTLLSIVGVVLLATAANLLTGAIAAAVLVSYLFLYTPLKRITPAATVVGGVPGALPPVIGWTAVREDFGAEPVLLFLLLFAWQMPHFYSLAWMYRKDYTRARFAVLTVSDAAGLRTARRMVAYSAALAAIAPAMFLAGMAGPFASAAGLLLGAGMFMLCWRFRLQARQPACDEQQRALNRTARRVFFASLLYLPLLFAALGADRA